jgi:hypothetical protein
MGKLGVRLSGDVDLIVALDKYAGNITNRETINVYANKLTYVNLSVSLTFWWMIYN